MFEWLEEEIAAIKTPRFHLIEGPADSRLKEAIADSSLPLPSSYAEFVLKFGNAKLYKQNRSTYQITIFAGPRKTMLDGRTRAYQIGFHDSASVFVKPSADVSKFSILEVELGKKKKVADDFAEWLSESCAEARADYGREKWGEILRGPAPFSVEEEQIVETRRRIRWRITGIDSSGDHIFEITNSGSRALPFLTLGVRSKDRHLNGAIRLRIGAIGPGETAVVRADCYKDLVSPQEVEVFSLPEPRPEDRDFYGEFQDLG
jgi:hypothetical protein